jgi:transcriptional regulator with XRE-family HTH domain
MNKEQEIFIKRLSELMEEYNISQVTLAKKIGITNVTISRYINGERSPRIEIVTRLAEVLNTTTDYLLGVTDFRNIMSEEQFRKELLESDFAKKIKPLTDEQKRTLLSLAEVWQKENEERNRKR